MTRSNVLTMECLPQEKFATDQWANFIDKRVGPGVLVLSAPARVLYMNRTASELIQGLLVWESQGRNPGGRSARGLLPTSLRKIYGEIFEHLAKRPCAKDHEEFELKRVVRIEHQSLLIRAFGVAEGAALCSSQAILVLEPIAERAALTTPLAAGCVPLTTREQGVVRCLAKGWTNKEIAGALHLALPTVKEHIRHIMEKTQTSTRTGILMRVFQGRVLEGMEPPTARKTLAREPARQGSEAPSLECA